MTFFKTLAASAAVLVAFAAPSFAVTTTGVAVRDSAGNAFQAGDDILAAGAIMVDGSTTDSSSGLNVQSQLGLGAIGYFIPLDIDGSTCVFGVDCGTRSDTGNGSNNDYMSMFIKFDPIAVNQAGTLTLKFLDLDVAGANDPSRFFEKLTLYGVGDTPLVYDEATDGFEFVPSNGDDGNVLQMLTIDFDGFASSSIVAELRFQSCYQKYNDGRCKGYVRNTAEYLSAHIDIEPVPLPAGGLLLLTGLAAFGATRRKMR